MVRRQSPVSLIDLIRARVIRPGQVLQYGSHEDIQAQVTPRGTVLYKGREYETPSGAARAVVDWPVNGWVMWRVKTRDDGFIKLGELRAGIEAKTRSAD